MKHYWQRHDAFLIVLCALVALCVSLLINISMSTNTNTQTVSININETTEPTPQAVNINTATLEELKTLPGIGETLGNRIIENRPYTDVWELASLQGVGTETMRKILPLVEI